MDTMFAVVRSGGKQYRVEAGTVLDIELVPGEIGETVELQEVLLIDNAGKISVGQPLVSGARVIAKIVGHKRGPKVTIYKKLRRHGKRLKKGHRQDFTQIKVEQIAA